MNLLPSNKQTEVFNRVQSENRLTQCQVKQMMNVRD